LTITLPRSLLVVVRIKLTNTTAITTQQLRGYPSTFTALSFGFYQDFEKHKARKLSSSGQIYPGTKHYKNPTLETNKGLKTVIKCGGRTLGKALLEQDLFYKTV
jgi:hypothetical protein